MKCGELMTKDPICCLPNDPVAKVAQMMRQVDIGIVPVIVAEETNMIIGVLTDRDIALKVIAESRDPLLTTAEEVMTRKVVTCQANDDIQKAFSLMTEFQLRRIPVVDSFNKIVGIISQADVAVRFNQPRKTAEIVRRISRPAISSPFTGKVKWRVLLTIMIIVAGAIAVLKLLNVI